MTREQEEADLKAQLDAAGIEYDGRWGVDRLRQALAKEQSPGMVLCRVKRDFWPTEDENDRVRKGQVIEVSALEALDGIESGALERVR